jgi:predicted  nucleic acid-binding Zn-ribbon protein
MEQTDLRPRLELRLTVLATRIAQLRHKMTQAAGPERIEELGEIDQLQERSKKLEKQLLDLEHHGAGAMPGVKAEIETMADDLAGTVDDFMMRIDAKFQLDADGKKPGKL